ncbi:2-dehydropantoate 2-reductase [Iamia majanohamensis]|uniref:2-dehydropantoate 2-reductase n=1 Tax=Iamia majanohamensis TaxID=467976 RepID=A0AAF0BV64_9ACTN|nr:2-dehydropantoate 2-reductase [Iamia majanohamensis]WCO66054.1 2-dehydropantoate 2-reductase [Iamia majanohamensis]
MTGGGRRYVVVGAGAVGGTIAGLLARAGRDVVAVARGPHLEALQAGGLDLRTPLGSWTVPLPAVGSVAEVGWRPGDVAVLAVKGQDTEALLDDLVAHADPSLPVVCAQNGVANERRALRRFADVHGMCVMLPAVHLEPGVVAAFGDPAPGILDLGRVPSGTDALDEEVAADLAAAGFSSHPHPAILRAKHRKLVMNLANAVVALCGTDALATDAGGELLGAVAAEGEAVLAAAGVDVASTEEDAVRRGDVFRIGEVEGVDRGGGSTWQSLTRGQGTAEGDTLNGEIALLARLHGVEAPLNVRLQQLVGRAAREGWRPGAVTPAEVLAARDA